MRRYPGVETFAKLLASTLPLKALASRLFDATVIEVRSHDRPGLLFRIGAAITQSKIDIRSAIVTTLGAEAIDTLYVTELTGGALTPERAIEVASHLKQVLK